MNSFLSRSILQQNWDLRNEFLFIQKYTTTKLGRSKFNMIDFNGISPRPYVSFVVYFFLFGILFERLRSGAAFMVYWA
jgi:hypothetical protein